MPFCRPNIGQNPNLAQLTSTIPRFSLPIRAIEICQELDNGRQVAVSCEFLATMDAMEEVLQGRKSAALPLGWVVALARLGGAADAWFSVSTRGGSVTVIEPCHEIVGPASDVGGEATR